MNSQTDKLDELFRLREEFMLALRKNFPKVYPDWPLDPTSKDNQIHIRDMALRGVEEMFESLQHLKNSKPHRQTDMPDFDRESFLEETVDSFNYFFTNLILLGVSSDEFHSAYEKKHLKIMERLQNGY